MKESEDFKTYHDLATGKVKPKPKYVRRSSRSKTEQAPKPFPGKSVKAKAKVAKSGKKKQPALGLETLIENSSDEENDDVEANIGKEEDDNNQEDDDNIDHDDDSKRTDSDNDGDDFVHSKFSTHDDEARKVEEGEKLDDEGANEDDEDNGLYRDVNINLEDVLVITTAEPPLLSATTLPPPSTPIIPHLQKKHLIVDKYIDNRMNESVKVDIQLQSDRLKDEAQSENEDFLNKLDENIQKIIKEQTQAKPLTPDRAWNKTLPTTHGPIQPWINNLARKDDSRTSFNELMDTPLDFSAFVMNRLKVDTLTLKLLAGPTYEMMKGSCKTLVELEFFVEEVYKETTDQLNRNNPEGQQYPHDLRKLLPLINTSRGHRVIPFDHFINNYLKYLRDGVSSQKDDNKLYKFKESDYDRLRIQDIEDMLLLLVQGKLTNLTIDECLAFNVSLRMLTRSTVIQRRMEDLQLAKDQEDYAEFREVCRWEIVRGRLSTALKDHAVRHRYSNPMIQPEQEGSTQGYPLVSVEVLRSILTDSQVTLTKHRRMIKPYSSSHFIANCFNAEYLKMEVKVPDSSCLKYS
nr:hypothetical protein [Tanacetum cinerariifolium]